MGRGLGLIRMENIVQFKAEVSPKLFSVLSTVLRSGALRTCTLGGGTGIAGSILVKTVAGTGLGRGGGASRMTSGACCGGGGG